MCIGLEAISVHVPKHYLDSEDLAKANGVDPEKYRFGIGIRQISIPSPDEDSVTMAFEAARTAIQRYRIRREKIGMLIVGSETGVDAAKPIASFVHGLLGLPAACRTLDTKHACYSATAALKLARDWCAGTGKGRKALVIASDIARYEVGSPGEPTQGAGAVAMVVSDSPVLFRFDDFPEATYTRDVMDFWRPHYKSTAFVQGRLSIESYLSALEHTYRDYREQSGLSWRDFDHALFHVPFSKMALKGFERIFGIERERDPELDPENLTGYFERFTLPSLYGNIRMGNLYSGSLYLSLACLLERRGKAAVGERIGLFSYGSGCCGEYFSGTAGADAEQWKDRIGLQAGLSARKRITHREYLAFRAESEARIRNGSASSSLDRPDIFATNRPSFLGIADNQRLYCIPELGDELSVRQGEASRFRRTFAA